MTKAPNKRVRPLLDAAPPTPDTDFVAKVAAMVDAKSAEGVTLTIPDGVTHEQATQIIAGRSMAWLTVYEFADRMVRDKYIAADAVALEFAAAVRELAQKSCLGGATSAREIFAMIDELLPMGAAHVPFAKNSGRGEGPIKALVRKVLPKLERKLKREATHLQVWHACAAQRDTNIRFVSSSTWGEPERAIPASGEPATWARFKVIVSEVRRSNKT